MATAEPTGTASEVAPYFDVLLSRLEAGDRRATEAFGRHVHWGYWPDPDAADGTPADYAAAAERLCRRVCDAAGVCDGMRILDVGCGLGGTVASLNERFRNLDLVGVNIDPRQLERAAHTVRMGNGNRVRWVEADACRLPDLGTFDAVLAVECIFHFDSRADFFAGVARALAAGGRLALSDFVPPPEALSTLRQHDPGADQATRQTYGRVNVLCPLEEYRTIAAGAGMTLTTASDLTAGTMPTYTFLRDDLRAQPGKAVPVHAKATARLEVACRAGLLTYSVLAFTKRADTSAAAA
jgi:cyclopropane fatty-acyl-phospholipid synthase-like methyltransferase